MAAVILVVSSLIACNDSDNTTPIITSKPSPSIAPSLHTSTTTVPTIKTSPTNQGTTIATAKPTENYLSTETSHTPEPTSITDTLDPKTLLFDPVLKNTNWELVSLSGTKPIEGTKITISFVKNNEWVFMGSTGCNTYERLLRKAIDGIFEYGQGTSVTLAGCGGIDGIMEQEQNYLDILRTVLGYEVFGDQLKLKNEANETVLIFKKSNDV